SPRGLLKPVAKTLIWAACVDAWVDWPVADAAATSPAATASVAAARAVRFMDVPPVMGMSPDPRDGPAAAHRQICPASGSRERADDRPLARGSTASADGVASPRAR